MFRFKNTQDRFGWIAIILHWVMALIIIFLLGLGLYMTRLPIGLEKLKLFGWHKEYGLCILWLVIFRLFWRISNLTPELALPAWEKLAARTVHWLFYIFMFVLPITGWFMSSAAGVTVSFFGLFNMPDYIAPNEPIRHLLAVTHKWLAYGLLATLCLHIAAALKHHFIDKDDILRRMLS